MRGGRRARDRSVAKGDPACGVGCGGGEAPSLMRGAGQRVRQGFAFLYLSLGARKRQRLLALSCEGRGWRRSGYVVDDVSGKTLEKRNPKENLKPPPAAAACLPALPCCALRICQKCAIILMIIGRVCDMDF